MADQPNPKKRKSIDFERFYSNYVNVSSTSATRISSKTITIATRILLDDAQNGFKEGNLVCSPLSLESMLWIIAAGAEGKTLEQLLKFLGCNSMEELRSNSPYSNLFEQVLSNPESEKGSLDICMANAAWVDKKLKPVLPSYKEMLKNTFKAKAKYVDFEKTDQVAEKINSWVKKKTKGLIPSVVGPDDIDGQQFVLANALYFKGLWKNQFDERWTEKRDFHLINGEKVLVPFMTSEALFRYGSCKGFKVLQIPYANDGKSNRFSMYIFLPEERTGLPSLLEEFHSNHALFHKSFDLDSVKLDELWIPKFKMSYTFEAKRTMEELGLTLPFSPEKAELTGIVGPKLLYITRIFQKSYIEVDETGTEAAAVTAVTGNRGCGRGYRPPKRPSFVAEHPFLFMIREDKSRAVFFVGVVLNPKSNKFTS